jgi:hypothetical protein
MQNKGLVLSLADVQALRQAGFTPKGTLFEGTPQGFADGGLADQKSIQGLIDEQTKNNRAEKYDSDAPVAALDPAANFSTPAREVTEGGFPNPTNQADVSGLDPTVTFNETTNRYEVKDIYGRVLYNIPDQFAARNYANNLRSGNLTVTPSTMTPEDFATKFPDQATDAAKALLTDTSGTGVTAPPVAPAAPAAPATTVRESLLGPTGLDTYNAAQANLMAGSQAPEEDERQNRRDEKAAGTGQPVSFADLGVTAPPEGFDATQAAVAGAAQAGVSQAAGPERPELATAEAVLASDEVKAYLQDFRAAQGEIAANNLVNAAISDPAALSQLSLAAAQIAEARQVTGVGARELTEGEMISGPSVEQARVEELVSSIKAETAQPSELATIQGQLAKLTADFDTENPPAWAAGALRNATAQMAARGLGSSSMAGQAIIQATFEAATPIAAADAATVAQFEQMNLSNRQQTTMLAAQQRAAFLGQEFDQSFQTKVANASKITEIANMNFNAEVQIALENARLAQSVDIANLNASNAKILSDAAALSNMDFANLNNRQQAAIANAKSFLDMNMANLNNEQQASVFKAQVISNLMLSDQAA